jgi:hypothetical protein
MPIYYDVVVQREAQAVLDFAISGGEALLLYGVDDSSEILNWINLADLALEIIPLCRESLHSCVDSYSTNRERVQVALSILRDATEKVNDPLYATLLHPSTDYRMLVEGISNVSPLSKSPHYREHL